MRCVLVVEDEESLAGIIAEGLAGSYTVECAYNVDDAVQLLLSAEIDLVLVDCVLPGGTMWQVVLEADRQNIPVVLMTGDPTQMKGLVGDPRPFILKPFSFPALIKTLEAAVRPPI